MKIFADHLEIKYESFVFSGGETHIQISEDGGCLKDRKVFINILIKKSSDLLLLLLATDALKRMGVKNISLYMPYIPYARQDRVCNKGEALSIKVFTDIINLQKYKKVFVLDPHSGVSTALINNCNEIDLYSCLMEVKNIVKDKTIICPDAGAAKKYDHLYRKIGNTVIYCEKKRDLKTGKIVKTDIKCNNIKADCIIIDDICDGGRTFIEIAKILKERGAKKIDLFVSHGIFSKGIDVFDSLIDKIYCITNFNKLSHYKIKQINKELR
jgi:ribose-phosphate pyrophosphokinase